MSQDPEIAQPDDAQLLRSQALAARVDALGNALRKKRDEAIAGRKALGIETEWGLAEESYQGGDAATRGAGTMGKPSSPYGGLSSAPAKTAGTRSTVVLNITRPYVDAAAARVADMLLPTDDSPWAIKPTPIASVLHVAPPVAPMMAAPEAGMVDPMAADPMAGAGMPMTAPDPAEATQEQARRAAQMATKQIEDWLVECQWHAEVRKVIEDCARLGTGVLKGPTPALRRRKMMQMAGGVTVLAMEERIAPESRCVSPWDLFPDPACGESIHDGAYVWERDRITRKGLRDLKSLGYLADQIDKVLAEGPGGDASDYERRGAAQATDADVFDVWYYHGTAEREDLEAAGVQGLPDDGDVSAHVLVTMVNGHVIKAAINPLDSGEFPYDVMPWQRRAWMPYGTGVAAQINVPQRMLTAAARQMMDNAGLSAGPQVVARRGALTPADGKWEISPRKLWWVQDGADVAAVNQAFMVFNIPSMQAELQNIVNFALKMAEDVTGLPAMMQGQATHAPDTVGGMQMLQNNAGTVLRRIARMFDDRITEPHIRRYYEWLMLHGEDDEAKGDFQIDARGSTALVERDMQNQQIMQMGALVANPAFGIDPEKWLSEMLKSQRLDPKRFQLDDEKKAAMAQQPPPAAPQVEAAKIRAEVDMQKAQLASQTALQSAQLDAQARAEQAQMVQQASVEKMRLDTDRDAIYVQSQARRDEITAAAKARELELKQQELLIKRELAMLEYANTNRVTLDKIKADLAKKAMEINATKELAGMRAPADMLPTPPIEPPGIAPAGESYQK